MSTVGAPTLQLLAWIDDQPRSYAETIEAWQTSCPRLAVWEDALADGLVRVDHGTVVLTPAGSRVLPTLPRRTSGSREATCSCGQLQVTAEGDPLRISMCHCRACQRRTGSAFGIQARFAADHVHVVGRQSEYVRTSDDGEERTFHFCPDCGATVFYTLAAVRDVIAIPIGAFADPSFPAPTVSVYESRRHPWLTVTAEMEHYED